MEQFTLYVETRSRYQLPHRVMPLPDETPDDGLGRVLVDSRFDPPRTYEELPYKTNPRSSEETVTWYRDGFAASVYRSVFAQAAARLCPKGRLWCVGVNRMRWPEALAEYLNRDVALLREGISHFLFAYQVAAQEVTQDTVWPFFSSDYGARLFVFDSPGTELERRLHELERVIRRNTDAVTASWEIADQQRDAETQAARLAGQRSVAFMSDYGRPEAANEAVALWRKLSDDCWYRERLALLCRDARVCVLPDLKHYGTVSFNSVALPAQTMADMIETVVCERGLPCTQVQNNADEWQSISDFDRFFRKGQPAAAS